jgi:hypothetical protein
MKTYLVTTHIGHLVNTRKVQAPNMTYMLGEVERGANLLVGQNVQKIVQALTPGVEYSILFYVESWRQNITVADVTILETNE